MLKVGALYIDRQEGKLRTVLELVRYRLNQDKIDGVLWLCTGRKAAMLLNGVLRHAPDIVGKIQLYGTESLSHRLELFVKMMKEAKEKRLMLVIDNGLLIKNPKALRTKRVIALSECCPYRLLVSDVPFTKNVADMYTQWRALDWRILGYSSYWGFSVNHLVRNKHGRNIDYLTRAIEPYCVQLLREDVQQTGKRKEYVWKFSLDAKGQHEYKRVCERFMWKALYSRTGVYRMLQACQHVTGGRRITKDYPLQTAAMYKKPENNPRIQALVEVCGHFQDKRLLILCRYRQQCDDVYEALCHKYGETEVNRYPPSRKEQRTYIAHLTVMNIFADEREQARLQADVIIYYSSDWDWRKRSEKERQCMSVLTGKTLTVVSIAAVDTIDTGILKCVWKKDNMVRRLQNDIREHTTR